MHDLDSTRAREPFRVREGLTAFVGSIVPKIPTGPRCLRCGHPPCECCGTGWCDVLVYSLDGKEVGAFEAMAISHDESASDRLDISQCCDGECTHEAEALDRFFAWYDDAPKCLSCRAAVSGTSALACETLVCQCAPKGVRLPDDVSDEVCLCRFDAELLRAWIRAYPLSEENGRG